MKQQNKKAKKNKMPKVLKVVLICFAALLLLFILVFVFFTQVRLGLFKVKDVYNFPVQRGFEGYEQIELGESVYNYNKDVISIILLGVDKADNAERSNNQADTIILLGINLKSGEINLLPIPRDTVSPVMHYDANGDLAYIAMGYICTAHSFANESISGGELMQASVGWLMHNIPMHGYMSISLDAVSWAADEVGGVPVEVTADFAYMVDAEPGHRILLTGEIAEQYVRGRSLPNMDGTNLSRMVRQRQFLFSFIDVVKQKTKKNITFPFKLYRGIQPYYKSDLSLRETVYLGAMLLQNSDKLKLNIMDGEMQGSKYVINEDFLIEYILDVYYTKQT